MKCNHCGKIFPLPVDNAPGIFLGVAVSLILIGGILWILSVTIWPWFLLGTGGFVALQAAVNLGDLNMGLEDGSTLTKCPTCKKSVLVKLWSI